MHSANSVNQVTDFSVMRDFCCSAITEMMLTRADGGALKGG